jgi:ribosomal protein S11
MVLYIKTFRNNVFLILSDSEGHIKYQISTKELDFQKRLRTSTTAITELGWFLIKSLSKDYGVKNTIKPSLILKTEGIGWKSNFKNLKKINVALRPFFDLFQIIYLLPIPHNGVKKRKKTR